MNLFGDKKRKSWQNLSFSRKQTKAGLLAQEQQRSHRVTRIGLTILFAVGVSFLINFRTLDAEEWTRLPGVFGVVLLVHAISFILARTFHRELLESVRRFGQLFVLVGLYLLVARAMDLWTSTSPFLFPLPLLAFPLALIYNGPLAIHVCMAVSVLTGLMVTIGGADPDAYWNANGALGMAVAASIFLGAVVAILGSARIRTRTKPFVVGVTCGIVQCIAILAFQIWFKGTDAFDDIGPFLQAPAWGLLNGVIAGFVITTALPFLERLFEVTTDMRLIELADQNRPLLRQFALLAPGSFQHSLMVGQLAEEAAQSIGANDLLARVGALYHDIGKMMKPNYFVENMREGDNVHDRLSPEMSRLIIVSHVKDGLRIAQEEGLPKPICDMIPMHHGTSLVEYFYRKKRRQEEEDGRSESGEEAFQYPGPRPTFREAGILMLADMTEAVSRVQSDPTPARLRTLVRDVIAKRVAGNQLDECELTMHDLSRIEDAFVRVLAAIHHGRVRYPGEEEDGKESGPEDGPTSSGSTGGNGRKEGTPPKSPPDKPETKGDSGSGNGSKGEGPPERERVVSQRRR